MGSEQADVIKPTTFVHGQSLHHFFVLCCRIHEEIQTLRESSSEKLNSLLLDLDHRFVRLFFVLFSSPVMCS